MLTLWPLLLPVAAWSGWYFARSKKTNSPHSSSSQLSRDYFVGLNYLLNEQEDKAVDVFIKLLEVDGDTVETHLALGSLFRRRGEVHRAIRIHQNLIARPQLSSMQRVTALVELGRDYLSAGVYDRAERIFREVISMQTEQTQIALRYLLDIYQREKSWEEAIEVSQKLASTTGETMHKVIAHHHCELAEEVFEKDQDEIAKKHLKRALSIDPHSVRASLLKARWEVRKKDYKTAIKTYQAVKAQDPDFISETIKPLAECYRFLNAENNYIQYLEETLDKYPRISIAMVMAEFLMRTQGMDAANDFIADHLQKSPSLRGLNELVTGHLLTAEGHTKSKFLVLQEVTKKLLKNKPNYRCGSCGFSGKKLHWQCPGCKQWSTTKPIYGLEGE
ncbi:MAG: lipopolysaccharide assembly protein LapB [Proteobacteria bacterium]|nr:lipopolysaccharide assembly protein LapB [Pseudomonadota bacterium]